VPHPAPWGWKISTYLWTKSIAAGVLLVAGERQGSLSAGDGGGIGSFGLIFALVALAVTMALLVFDLKRPDRFFYLLTKPNFRSWLVLGGYILGGYGISLTAWLISERLGGPPAFPLRLTTYILALASAGYSAFLFAQAKGRDLWQSSLFFFHLLVQAMIAGTAVVVLVDSVGDLQSGDVWDSRVYTGSSLLAVWLIIHLGMILAEILIPHATKDARLGIRSLVRGKWAASFWVLVMGIGIVVPGILLFSLPSYGYQMRALEASTLVLIGLWFWEDLWVKAGQSVPLS